MSLKVWPMANRQTGSSRARRAATSSGNGLAPGGDEVKPSGKLQSPFSSFPPGTAFSPKIRFPTGETLGRRSYRRLFSRFWRPVRYPVRLPREIVLAPSTTSRPGCSSGFWTAPGSISAQPVNAQFGVTNFFFGWIPVNQGKMIIDISIFILYY